MAPINLRTLAPSSILDLVNGQNNGKPNAQNSLFRGSCSTRGLMASRRTWQASDAPAGKRKRGRPRVGQGNKQHADASSAQPVARRDGDDDDDDGSRPRKRGKTTDKNADSASTMDVELRQKKRSRKSLNEVAQDEPPPESSRNSHARKQKPRAQQQEPAEHPLEAEPEPASLAPRRSQARQREQRGAADEQAEDEAPRRRRDRPSKQDAPPAVQKAPRGRRGRPSLQPRREDEDPHEGENGEPHARPRNRARPSRRGLSPSQAQDVAPERRKGGQRQRKTKTREEDFDREERTLAQNVQRKAAATARSSKTRPDIQQPSPTVAQTHNPKRRRSRQHADRVDAPPDSPSAPPPSPPKPYAHIVPHVRRVRQSTIAAKWSPLTGPSLSAVSALLQLAHRPILQRLSDSHQRRAHASAALRLTARRISRKVAARGLPFPPASMPAAPRRGGQQQQPPSDGGREVELDFESVLDAKAALEAQLGPAAHAVELLRREKNAVERELERDYETLRELEARARSQAREQRGLLKKAHALTPLVMIPEQPDDARARQSVVKPAGGTTATASLGNLFTVSVPLSLIRLAPSFPSSPLPPEVVEADPDLRPSNQRLSRQTTSAMTPMVQESYASSPPSSAGTSRACAPICGRSTTSSRNSPAPAPPCRPLCSRTSARTSTSASCSDRGSKGFVPPRCTLRTGIWLSRGSAPGVGLVPSPLDGPSWRRLLSDKGGVRCV